MKIIMTLDDLIGWIIIGAFLAFMLILSIAIWIQSKIQNFKDWRAKKKREKEANGE